MNYLKIILYQNMAIIVGTTIRYFKTVFKKGESKVVVLEDINYFSEESNKSKRALISLSPSAWLLAKKQYPNIKLFNIIGLIYIMVKVLNEKGYLVDIVDHRSEYMPTKDYDLFIGHGGYCRTIIDNLPSNAKIIQYVAGAFWKSFNKESEERYNAFIERKNVKEQLKIRRNLDGLIEGEEYLTRKADIFFTGNNPRMINSFGKYKDKFFITGYGSYIDNLLFIPIKEKDFEKGRKNFIYVGGSNGNIQKGMDLLIETFVSLPELNLYIYCKVEEEILKYYKNELKAKNIHYVYHWRFKPFQRKLKNLVKEINFTIHAPINTGIGTAFMGSMGVGLIPVGYVDLVAPKESCVLTNSWQIDDLVKCVKEASSKSAEWCKNASELTIRNYKGNYSVENFETKFYKLIDKVNII